MRKQILGLFVAVGLLVMGSSAFAQTATPSATASSTASNTPTNTPTITQTPTQTPTKTPTLAPQDTPAAVGVPKACDATRYCAWKFIDVTMPTCACNTSAFTCTVTIPGVQRGDFIYFNISDDGNVIPTATRVLSNNRVEVTGLCTNAPTATVMKVHWWDRTYIDTSKNAGDAQ